MSLELIFIIILIVLSFATLVFLPGPALVSLAIVIYGFMTNFAIITFPQTIVVVLIGIFGSLVDNILVLVGAKKFGASKSGLIGAFIGMILGVFMAGIGVLIGPFIGAFVGEVLVEKAEPKKAARAALGAVIGLFTGVLAKFIIALGMTIWFGTAVF